MARSTFYKRSECPSILFITRKWEPAMGGMETYSVRLTEEINRMENLDIIALPGKENGDVPSAFSLIWFGLETALRILFMKSIPIIHIGDVASWPLGWIASLRHPRSRIILSAHGSDLHFATTKGLAGRIYAKYIWLAAKLLCRAKIIANSDWIASLARDQGFLSVTLVPLATDMKTDQVPVAHNGCLFFAGRIMPSKGLSFAIEKVLPLLNQPMQIRVAGTIWDKEEAKLLGSPSVEYLGVLGREQLAEEYSRALCVIIPSLSKEGFGLVAVEAAACGAVVLASNHSGLAEVVTEEMGYVADPSYPQDWAAIIEMIQSWSDATRAAFVENSIAISRRRYSWDRVAKETLAAYGEF